MPWDLGFVAGSMLAPVLVRRIPPCVRDGGRPHAGGDGFAMFTRIDLSTGFTMFAIGSTMFALGLAPVFTLTTDLVVGPNAIVSGLVGPDAPDGDRWETLWHYMQGGPGVFKGDLYFYKLDGDIRDRVAQIDTAKCPLFLLSGEYDYSCTPEETLAVANSIKGSQVTIMKGLGHFPMSEDPEKFLGYLLPVLKEIK